MNRLAKLTALTMTAGMLLAACGDANDVDETLPGTEDPADDGMDNGLDDDGMEDDGVDDGLDEEGLDFDDDEDDELGDDGLESETDDDLDDEDE
ncbi:hypothetical protein [Alkalibacterium olivapovliticus]|uniref:DNA primase n=1 Tax=Alkalibacterium olivapovliticus TaxID=99907 RepID=A0A2T0W9N7_9LACT|nr:hypothetical protein [Alkalibacterium olivapovliticus]PRY83430.1 hypothetical protein CLV38_10436 [Alkalibacterium olivapovliticus]